MSDLENIRNQFGLSQQQMADFLDITRTQYSMVETNKRYLPTASSIKLAFFNTERNKASTSKKSTNTLSPEQNKAFNTHLTKQINNHKNDIARHTKTLAAHKTIYAQALQKSALVNSPQAKALTGKDAAWLAVIEDEADNDIENNHEGIQSLLQIKIDALTHQMAALSKLL